MKNININEHKFMSLVPTSELQDSFDFSIGERVDIVIIGKGTLKDCVIIMDFAYTINGDKTHMIIINLKKGKPYIRILHKN